MTLLCPNCLHPVDPDPSTGALPAVCPSCGWDRERFRRNVRKAFPELSPTPPVDEETQVAPSSSFSVDPAPPLSPALPTPPPAMTIPAPATQPADAEESAFIDALFSEESAAVREDPETDFTEGEAEVLKPLPAAMRRPMAPAPAPIPRWLWAALPVLALTLGLQILMADRVRLAGDAAWRPWLETICGALRCTLPPWHEPDAFRMLDRGVEAVSGQEHVLRIHASFRNDARWPQPWPNLELSLSDADGRLLGRRVFTPGEYHDHAVGAELAPGETGDVVFLIREPSSDVVAFHFVFR